MTVIEVAVTRQPELWWALAGLALTAMLFRLIRPSERRALRVTWLLVALVVVALAGVARFQSYPMFATTVMGLAVVCGDLAAIHLLSTIIFRGVLPALGVNAPRIALDLTVLILAVAWGILWLRLGGWIPRSCLPRRP